MVPEVPPELMLPTVAALLRICGVLGAPSWRCGKRSRRKTSSHSELGESGTTWPRPAWIGPGVTGDFQEIGIYPGQASAEQQPRRVDRRVAHRNAGHRSAIETASGPVVIGRGPRVVRHPSVRAD